MLPRSNAAGRDGSAAKCWLKFWRTALARESLADQRLLDDLDVRVLDFNFDVLVLRHDESRVGGVARTGPRRAATIPHAALARKDPAFKSVPAAIIGATVACEQ